MVTVSMRKTPSMVNPTLADSPRPRIVRYQVAEASTAPRMKCQNQGMP